MRSVTIYFKDGSKDWIDPINDPDIDIVYKDDKVFISNGFFTYDYDVKLIDKIELGE